MLEWGIQLDKDETYGATTRTPAGLFWNTQTAAYEAYNAAHLDRYDTGATTDARGWTHGTAPDGSDVNGNPIVLIHLKASANFIASELETAEAMIEVSGSLAIGGGGSGNGDVAVDHNYSGTDALRVVGSDNLPVDNAVIRAYVLADYNNGDIDPQPPTTYTGSDGRWVEPLSLDADTYKVIVYNPLTKKNKSFTLEVE